MTAYPPAPAPATPARAAAGWLAFSAAMTAQVPPIAGRDDLTVTAAPGAGQGAAACFFPPDRHHRDRRRPPTRRPRHRRPRPPVGPRTLPRLVGRHRPRVRPRRPHPLAPPPRRQPRLGGGGDALEESRIERRQLTRRPGDRRWLRACTRDLLVGDFAAAAAPPASRPRPARPPP